jgi:hypothetical protein
MKVESYSDRVESTFVSNKILDRFDVIDMWRKCFLNTSLRFGLMRISEDHQTKIIAFVVGDNISNLYKSTKSKETFQNNSSAFNVEQLLQHFVGAHSITNRLLARRLAFV